MRNEPLCSICCVGYKHAAYLEYCINSIWENTYRNIEIIALDDGSRDGSLEKLEAMAVKSPCPFTVLRQENTGNVPLNFNRTFRASRGGYILFISLDDMLLPDSINSKMELATKDASLAFVAHAICLKLMREGILARETFPLGNVKKHDLETFLLLERTYYHSFYIQNAIFRRDVLEQVGVFSENMIGDDIVLRTKTLFWLAKHRECSFALINKPGFIYRDHAGNVHKNMIRQMNLVLQYHEKFWRSYPFPPVIKNWLLHMIKENSPEESMNVFEAHPIIQPYLEDKDIAAAMNQCKPGKPYGS